MSGSGLVRYDAARHALRVATQVDEVKDIRDKAQALALYAKQAKDTELLDLCKKLQLRAERRIGELLAETERAKGGRPPEIQTLGEELAWEDHPPEETGRVGRLVSTEAKTLKDIGLSKDQSADFQAIAALPEEVFEQELATGTATTESLVRVSRGLPKPPKVEMVPKADYDKLAEAFAELQGKHQELIDELEAIDLMRSDKMVGRYASLQEQLRTTERTRNDAMNQAVQLQKQTNWYLRELTKLGWSPQGRKPNGHATTA